LWESYEIVELLWGCCWCLYMLCAYMLLVNFLTCYWCWIVDVSMYWNMLVMNTFVFNYSGWLWCSVGIRGDGLGDDLVPHAYRSCLGALHKNNMIDYCLCARCELRVGAFVCLVISCNWRILYLCKYCW